MISTGSKIKACLKIKTAMLMYSRMVKECICWKLMENA